MTATTGEKRLAIWQTAPCPEWCVTQHDDADHPDSRECMDRPGATPLTHEDLLDVGEGAVALDTLHVELVMPVGCSPRIVTSRGNGAYTTTSLDEAEQHAERMLERVRLGRATVGAQCSEVAR